MASKNLSTHDDETQLPPDLGFAVQLADSEEPKQSTSGLLANKVLALDGGSRAGFFPPDLPDSDNYQVVLIPPANRGHMREVDSLTPVVPPVLLLSLTWKELALRMRNEVDPANFVPQNRVMRFGHVRVDLFSMEVSRSDQRVSLTALEFKLLRFLLLHPERVLSRDELLKEVWGYNHYPSTRTVDNHLWRLRQKLELDPIHPVHFRTVHGIGYKFVPKANVAVLEQKS
jgi:DNA-binding winged helix-turn-helix (wHTH) protein